MGSIRTRTTLTRAVLAAALAGGLLGPAPAGAQEPSAEEQLQSVREQAEAVAAEIDVLEAEDAEIQAAILTLQTHVAGQQVIVNAANDALAVAEADVAESTAQIEALETQVADLEAAADQMLVDAFTDPPINHALDVLRSDTLADATVKDAIIDIQAEADADAIELLDTARTQLEAERETQEELVAEAAVKKADADAAMADLETALAQQAQFASDVEARLDERLAQAASLAESDAALSRQIAEEQAATAAALEAAQAQASGSTVTPAPGGLATVSCPATGGSITVAGSIAGNVQALLDASAAAGVSLCGGGYRDPQQQIELRKAHCGTSDYAIYEMPSSECSPPTARPGSSMHEQGLAIDFTCNGGGTVSRGSTCWNWLAAHAGEYGLYNLPSEPWHWSTNGN